MIGTTVLNTLNFKTTKCGRYNHFPLFIDKDTKAESLLNRIKATQLVCNQPNI